MGNNLPTQKILRTASSKKKHPSAVDGDEHGNGASASTGDTDGAEGTEHQPRMSRKKSKQYQTTALQTLFQKLELTADEGNVHPGELSRATFENAFSGPLHKFGKLMYLQMMTSSTTTNRERITREQFVKAGRSILKMYDEKSIVKYYFYLFAAGKEYLTKEDAFQMFEISFSLTLSLSKILYQDDERDPRIFVAMVTGLFGPHTELRLEDFTKWLDDSCPTLFHSVHNWVSHVLTGSSLPDEMEMARVPQLEGVIGTNNCTSMAILWLLSITLPPNYTKAAPPPSAEGEGDSASGGVTKDPMWTSMLLLRKKMARIVEVHNWRMLYNSDEHGLSINRFSNHVSAYNAPTVTFISFEGKNLYCLAIDQGWREGPSKFGGEDCRLIQLTPVYRVIQSGGSMVRWSENARGVPKGIHVGCDGKTEVLKLPMEFNTVQHYEVPCEISKIEVWGCGLETALQAQQKQKKWETAAVRREQSRKLNPLAYGESWKDSPDKQILQWGGVTMGSGYNR